MEPPNLILPCPFPRRFSRREGGLFVCCPEEGIEAWQIRLVSLVPALERFGEGSSVFAPPGVDISTIYSVN